MENEMTHIGSFVVSKKPSKLVITQCGNLKIFPPRFFCKHFAKSNISLLTVNQFDEKFSQWGKISDIFTLCIMFLKHFRQKFRESNAFTKEITKELI